MELSAHDIEILLEIIDNTNVSVKQTNEVVNPIRAKLEGKLLSYKTAKPEIKPPIPAE